MTKAMRDLTLLALSSLMLAGCAREVARPAPVPQTARRAPPAGGAAVSTASYVATAAAIDLFEIRSSEMALQRSNNRALRDFASMMIAAHKGTSAQLSFAGRRLNLLPSATLSPQYQALVDQLVAAPDFDAAYRGQQRLVHREALRLHSAYAARGASPTLRPVAAAIVPIVERHMRMIAYF